MSWVLGTGAAWVVVGLVFLFKGDPDDPEHVGPLVIFCSGIVMLGIATAYYKLKKLIKK